MPCATGSKYPMVLADLLEYPSDHSKTYWSENRLSKAFRFRKHPCLDMLGTPVPESNSFEKDGGIHSRSLNFHGWKIIRYYPKNMLHLTPISFTDYEKTNSSALYPSSRMIVIAIEAMKQSTMFFKDFVGFNLKEVFFQTALVIPLDREGVGIEFTLLSSPHTSEKSKIYRLLRHSFWVLFKSFPPSSHHVLLMNLFILTCSDCFLGRLENMLRRLEMEIFNKRIHHQEVMEPIEMSHENYIPEH